MNTTHPAVLSLFRRQQGVASRKQLLAVGVSRSTIARAVRDRRLLDTFPGVYRHAATPESDEQRLFAATLAVEGAVVSHRAAAWLHDLAGFKRLDAVEVSTVSRQRAVGVTVHRSSDLGPLDTTTVRDVPVTQPGRTLLDLCELEPAWKVARALDDALRRRLVRYETLVRLASERGQGHRGARMMRDLLAERGPEDARAVSELETRFLRLLRRAKLPMPPLINIAHHDEQGDYLAKPDFAWRRPRLAVFLDGRQFHGDAKAFENDRGQSNALADRGWHVRRYTWRQVNDEEASIARALRQLLRPNAPAATASV